MREPCLLPRYGGARQRDGREADQRPEVACGEDGRPLRLRTPTIRCDRPTVQGPPAFAPAQCPRVGGRPIPPQRTSGVMLKTTRVRASTWSRTSFQNAVFKLSMGSDDFSRLKVFVNRSPTTGSLTV